MYIHERGDIMKNQSINKSRCYCIWLCRAANAVTAFYDEELKDAGISAKQFSLLINLGRIDEASTGELAECVKLERSTLARKLKALQNAGWISDMAKEGSRSHRYVLTETGREQLKRSALKGNFN